MISYGRTDVGSKRQMNQDYVYYSDKPVGNLPNLYIVADGMGGHKAGDVASRYTVTQFVSHIKENNGRNPISIIDDAILKANEELIELANTNEDFDGMGTTLVVCSYIDKSLFIANIGDSRLYLINKEKIKQITRDHSYVEEMVSNGEISRSNARLHEKKNIITRAVGASMDVISDIFEISYHHGDIILMCTDGLSNMVDDETIKDIVLNHQDLELATKKLVDEANKNGGKDNISVLIVRPE
ncbi:MULTISPECIES: Stp1/IreP family PP2C-type Ser/Thr phosphatase [Eubacterium]|uniref:Protein phosphatase n=1 Tax=Eubacterium uniforme TaxID=39495 RepID=A0A1T4V974_9FIRM|nr:MULTISPECIES: Stp1/IreP family PP2C-type Ser/Thr phosphatase [Eubacterium]MCR5629500.1 Stp1/IreP family PP2C-type Ser/Thr phosphatase [Eubacterium sp.]SKA61091.1 protein phosphatase [Eubacterium uniforme]HAV91406.1 Stp1/IreP family PP2C-type Ser/Thr phosphatase [Eubacterium sp.]